MSDYSSARRELVEWIDEARLAEPLIGPHDGGWVCEQHPEREWPHDDCAGPGMLLRDVRRDCVRQQARAEQAEARVVAIQEWLDRDQAIADARSRGGQHVGYSRNGLLPHGGRGRRL